MVNVLTRLLCTIPFVIVCHWSETATSCFVWRKVSGRTPTPGGFAGQISATEADCCRILNLGLDQTLNSVTNSTLCTNPVFAFTSAHRTLETESLVRMHASSLGA